MAEPRWLQGKKKQHALAREDLRDVIFFPLYVNECEMERHPFGTVVAQNCRTHAELTRQRQGTHQPFGVPLVPIYIFVL